MVTISEFYRSVVVRVMKFSLIPLVPANVHRCEVVLGKCSRLIALVVQKKSFMDSSRAMVRLA